jgi:hypothetical protein
MSALARRAGFEIVDLSNVYDGYDLHEVRIAEWDQHPSQRGHRILADRLYEEMLKRRSILAPSSHPVEPFGWKRNDRLATEGPRTDQAGHH